MKTSDQLRIAQAIASTIPEDSEPVDAVAIAVFVLAIVAFRHGLRVTDLTEAMETAGRAVDPKRHARRTRKDKPS